MSKATVSANVGIDWCGSFTVCRCSMPPSPYQFLFLMRPVPFVVLSNAECHVTGVDERVWQQRGRQRTHKGRGT